MKQILINEINRSIDLMGIKKSILTEGGILNLIKRFGAIEI